MCLFGGLCCRSCSLGMTWPMFGYWLVIWFICVAFSAGLCGQMIWIYFVLFSVMKFVSVTASSWFILFLNCARLLICW